MLVLTTWHTTWGAEVVVTALAAFYLRTTLHAGGWPAIRTVSAMAALAVVVVTVDSGVGVGASRSVAVGVAAQLLLTSVAVPLWVAGRPLELLRRGCSARVSATLDRVRKAAAIRVLTSPPAVLVIYAVVLVLTRLTAFPVAAATSPALGVLEQIAWPAAGLLVFGTALAPARGPVGLLVLGGAAAVTAAVGLVLAGVPAVLLPAFSPDEVHRGGTTLWVAGDGLLLVVAAALGCRCVARRPSREHPRHRPVH